MTIFVMLLLYLRNFASIVALGASGLALARIAHCLGNRGTRRLKQYVWGGIIYHAVTIIVTAGQLIGTFPVNRDITVTVAYTAANVVTAATAVIFSLYVLGIINGDPHDHAPNAHTPPMRRKDDVIITAPSTVEG